MALSQRLKAFLDNSHVRYSVASHPIAYTAQEIAAAQHVPGRQLAKSVLVKTNRGPTLAVLPAIRLVDLKKLKTLLRAKTLSMAKEPEVKNSFPDVEVGAMSPFGNLYNVSVAVDRELGEAEEIVFNGGSHSETIKMRYQDFATLVKPKVGAFGKSIGQPTRRSRVTKKSPKTRRVVRTRAKPRKPTRKTSRTRRR